MPVSKQIPKGDVMKESSIFQKFNEQSSIKKASICIGALLALFLIFMFVLSLSSVSEEYGSYHINQLCNHYESYDLYVESYHAWANSLYNNDSAPADLGDVMKDDAIDAAKEMHDEGMSIADITEALNKPVGIDYENGIVDSPTLYDEDYVRDAVN